jgi:lipopolysaccharide/colanic/teichoic acid biosynthesis glycosyltransferase
MPRSSEALKRIFDLISSAIGLVVLSPIFLILIVLIRLDSPGPAFYRPLRTGRFGVPFRIWKFRTMYIDSDKLGGTTGANDLRITKIGSWLRRYKIDELPQLINVITGDMSLVGPRPELEEHTSAYSPDEQQILKVRPGITDESSMRFHNLGELVGDDDPHRVFIEKFRTEKNRLRLDYVRNQSFSGDMRILFRTLKLVIARR